MAQTKTTVFILLATLFCVSHAFDFGRKFSYKRHNDTNPSLQDKKVRPDTDAKDSTQLVPESADGSFSETVYNGWLFIVVLGTGQACYIKEFRSDSTVTREAGQSASSNATADLYGYADCEVGDIGLSWGKIRASVAAAAYQNGPECLSRVIASVINDPSHVFSKGDVNVTTSGEFVGEAMILCDL